ncbi:TonB-dependent receptor [Oceaniserpentilla sp. 4NH20-0058]|uniref:TonB-dependent receptor n=1 Tax=Oceaniserpentilla sp. 4NH20-0058 TaxID=3127660 RepID=UPI00310BC547
MSINRLIHAIFCASISLVLIGGSHAFSEEVVLEEVRVTASGQALNDVAQPIQIMNEDDIHGQNGDTLGDILSSLPGISNASFGAGVGRPVIRGLGGNRVKMAINGTDSADVSAMSSDHAPMVDAANAKQIEVIYGPNTLRYGSSAMGGVVNMADARFHEYPALEPWHGHVESAFSSVDAGTKVKASLDAAQDQWVVHLDGFNRSSDNFKAGNGTTIENTASDSQGANLGVNYLSDNGNAHGIALSVLDYEYGVPNPDNDRASVNPSQVRLDGQSIVYSPIKGIQEVKTQFTYIDYQHGEYLGDIAVGLFNKTASEFKTTLSMPNLGLWQASFGVHWAWQDLQVCHDHGGCTAIPDYSQVSWDGAQGVNLTNGLNGGYLFAHDTPMPLTQTQDLGMFWVMERDWALGILELGARIDQRTIEADPTSIRTSYRQTASYYDDKQFNSASLSAAMTWRFDKDKLGVSVSRSQRAPSADELYWNGDHHATFSFQLDNGDLDLETAYSVDVTWIQQGEHYQLQGAVYYYDFDGYIYNELKNLVDPNHGDPVYRHEQRDARFTGAEWQFDHELTDDWKWFVRGDVVQARLKEGVNKNLPRIPPFTSSTGFKFVQTHWQVSADVKYYAQQSDVAENESSSADYYVVNAYGSYEFSLDDHESVKLYLKAYNITDQFGRNHVSYLKEYSPIIGRNITIGANYSF